MSNTDPGTLDHFKRRSIAQEIKTTIKEHKRVLATDKTKKIPQTKVPRQSLNIQCIDTNFLNTLDFESPKTESSNSSYAF